MTPRSSANKVAFAEGKLKIWVTSAPTDGEANAAVIAVLAKALRVAPSRISIIRGETSREKLLRLEGISEAEFAARLANSGK
ncbi:MAG: DUF167 domain-containing protein [Fimbriimonas sp.]